MIDSSLGARYIETKQRADSRVMLTELMTAEVLQLDRVYGDISEGRILLEDAITLLGKSGLYRPPIERDPPPGALSWLYLPATKSDPKLLANVITRNLFASNMDGSSVVNTTTMKHTLQFIMDDEISRSADGRIDPLDEDNTEFARYYNQALYLIEQFETDEFIRRAQQLDSSLTEGEIVQDLNDATRLRRDPTPESKETLVTISEKYKSLFETDPVLLQLFESK